MHVSAKVKESTHIRLPSHISTEDNNTSGTQIVEPALGFTLAEIRCAQTEPKLTVQQLLEIESCKDYVKTPLQTLDGIYINQPKRFLPLTKEAKKKLVEEFQKEQKDSYPLPRRQKKTSGGISKRANCILVGWTPT